MLRSDAAAPSASKLGGADVGVVEAVAAARAAAVAAEEASTAVREAEKKAATAVNLVAVAADKVACALVPVDNTDAEEGNLGSHPLSDPHVRVRNSLRYAIQEIRRQTNMINCVTKLCSTIPEVEDRKIGKVIDHLHHIRKMLDETAIVCEEDLNNKEPFGDINYLEDSDHSEYYNSSSEDEELWDMVFWDRKFEEEKANVPSMAEQCRQMGWNYEEFWDRGM